MSANGDVTGRAAAGRPRRLAVVVNPAAGAGRAADVARRAGTVWSGEGIAYRELLGDSPAHARELVRETAERGDVDAVVVVGGDGMISLVVDELNGLGLPVGVVPAGSGNDFARDLGIPRRDPEAAAAIVARGRTAVADVGRITDPTGGTHHFATVMCAGFDSEVNRRVNELDLLSGSLRYVWATATTYPGYRAKPYRLVFDDDEVVEEPVVLSAYAVTRYYGGGMKICPDADRGDGMLDVTWIRDMPKLVGAWNFRKVFRGGHVGHPSVRTRRCRSVRVEAPGVEAYADGDPVAALPVTVEAVPGAMTYLVP